MIEGRRLRQSIAALLLLALSASTLAQEICGVTVILHRDGFEAGGLPPYAPPADSTLLSLTVDFPAEGATVGTDRIALAGSFTGPANVGISSDSQIAATTNTRFVTRPIALSVGANAITVNLSTIDGLNSSVVRNVTYDPGAAPQVSLTPVSGTTIIPGTVRFTATKRVGEPLSLTRLQLDYDGNGSTDVDTSNASNLSFVYQQPGLFTVTGTATLDDTDPQTPAVQVPISTRVLAQHPQQSRFALCSLFGTMRSRLAAADVSGALNVMTPDLRPRFQTLWTSLGAQLPTVATQLGVIVDGRFAAYNAELILARPFSTQPLQSRAYRIQMERDATGVWRIVAM